MGEEIVIMGKENPHVYPHLELWGWPIALYLFLGGLAAGLIFFSSYFYLKGEEEKLSVTVKKAVLIAPVALILGLAALVFDLHHPLYSWRLYTTINLDSPMSWGAWTLLFITPLSILWSLTFLPEISLKWKDWIQGTIVDKVTERIRGYRKPIAIVQIVLAVILGIYTGILLSAFNARPLWNTGVLGFIFLVSGFSTAAATIMWMSPNRKEKLLFGKIDAALIVVEIVLIVHMFMGLLSGPEASVQAAEVFLFGKYAFWFWGVVVVLGLLLPLILESLEILHKKVPVYLTAASILIGGLVLRVIITEAGQWISYIQ